MNAEITSISVDYSLILRLLLALAWGFGWAAFLQFSRWGVWLVEERTWITVVIGIGIDLLIAYDAGWWTITAVIAFSSIGILIRSLHNEQRVRIDPKKYKAIWGLEDAIAASRAVINALTMLLESGELAAIHVAVLSKQVGKLHKLNDTLIALRRGDYNQGKV